MFSNARSASYRSSRDPITGFGPRIGQQFAVPGPDELIRRAGSWLRISVWDGDTDQIIPDALVEARRADGEPGFAKDMTGRIGVAILRLPDVLVGTPVIVKVSAKGYSPVSLQLKTITRAEANDDFAQDVMVDLKKAPGLETLAIALTVVGAIWWGLS